jgi:hypothetical protein
VDIVKNILLVIIFFIPVQFMAGQVLLFRVIEDAPAWNYPGGFRNILTEKNWAIIIKKDETVWGSRIFNKDIIDGKEYLTVVIIYNTQEYMMQANRLVPAATSSLFDDSWISSPDNGSDAYWIRDGYLGALASRSRDTFYNVERNWIDSYNSYKDIDMYIDEEWYEYANVRTCLEINQIGLLVGGFLRKAFWITNIMNINSGYKVTVFDPEFVENHYYTPPVYFYNSIPFPSDRDVFELLFIRDNDYMEMYLDTAENHLATFVKVNKDIMDMLNTLLKTNACDLSKITSWPRRADGSMDYPPPLNMSNYTATHRTIDNLRLRDSASTAAKIVTTLPKGTEVQALEAGPASTIDGITAPWMRVISYNGYIGWCFSGYLEEIRKPDVANSVDIASAGIDEIQADEAVQGNAEPRSLPLWALLAIIGGAILAVGGAVLFVVKWKKRRNPFDHAEGETEGERKWPGSKI